MRVKFNDKIYLATRVSHLKNSKLLRITTSNGIYTVDMDNCKNAEEVYEKILVNGYYDFSEYEYNN